jgi:hypothetical protein
LGKDYVQDITWVKVVCAGVIAFSVWLVGRKRAITIGPNSENNND